MPTSLRKRPARSLAYLTVWRWHFYAGLLCIPFVTWLSVTGGLYLFKPQIESWLDRPYDHLPLAGQRASASAHVQVALAAVPGSVLNAYELPQASDAAVRVLVGHGQQLIRVYVHPHTLAILHTVAEDQRPMRVLFRLHGELLMGDAGSVLVELAASWTIVLIVTGLYLWWPRRSQGVRSLESLGGLLWPRLGRSGRGFWRDLHAVVGMWVAIFTLFLLVSGLPWAKSLGGLLKELRSLGRPVAIQQDWTTGRSSELKERQAENTLPPAAEDAAGHAAHSGHEQGHGALLAPDRRQSAPIDLGTIDRLLPVVSPLGMAHPVLIAPPSMKAPSWTARSEAQNRPLREKLLLDGTRGRILKREAFAQRPYLDRLIGYGVAAHEGQLFGPLNVALGVFTAVGLLLVSAGGVMMWWRRRAPGTLGAPMQPGRMRYAPWVVALIVLLGLLLPLLGISLLLICLLERTLWPHWPRWQAFLGLQVPPPAHPGTQTPALRDGKTG